MAVKSAAFENQNNGESRFVDVSDEFLNELLDNSILALVVHVRGPFSLSTRARSLIVK
jgi:hypothetical protein